MDRIIIEKVKTKITLRNKPTKNEIIYMVGQAELSYLGFSISFIRVMCDWEAEETYIEFPKFYTRSYIVWIKNRRDLELIERMLHKAFKEEIETPKSISSIRTEEIDDRVMDGKYLDLSKFKAITYTTRNRSKD